MAITEYYVSTTASGGGAGTEGDPWTLSEALSSLTGSQRANIKDDGVYTLTADFTPTNGGWDTAPQQWRGYSSTIGDGGKPTIACGTSYRVLTGEQVVIESLSVTGNHASSLIAPTNNRGAVVDCNVTNLSGSCFEGAYLISRCLMVSTGTPSFVITSSGPVDACRIILSGGGTGDVIVGGTATSITRSIIIGGGTSGYGISLTSPAVVHVGSNVIYDVGNGVHANTTSTVVSIVDNIIYNVGGYGIVGTSKLSRIHMVNNAMGDLTSGRDNMSNVHEISSIVLTADPFVDAANGDFRLNDAAGGGRLCKFAGLEAPTS